MSYIRLFLAVIIMVLLTAGCGEEVVHHTEIDHTNKYVGVRKVLVHQVGQYSVFVPGEKGGYVQKELARCKATFFEDVPQEEDMYAEETYYSSTDYRLRETYCTFHVHSLKEIGGGGWHHGKFGRGQTNVIE